MRQPFFATHSRPGRGSHSRRRRAFNVGKLSLGVATIGLKDRPAPPCKFVTADSASETRRARVGRGAIAAPFQREGGVVGARGFEPPTSSSRTMRATKLRHAPTE